MKISRIECGNASVNAGAGESQEKILPKEMPRKGIAGQAAQASLTPLEQGIATAMEALGAVPDTRDELVEDIRSRIERGEYEVSGEDVADMMMRRRAADRLR